VTPSTITVETECPSLFLGVPIRKKKDHVLFLIIKKDHVLRNNERDRFAKLRKVSTQESRPCLRGVGPWTELFVSLVWSMRTVGQSLTTVGG
jgi:hypothetical protein